MTDRKTLIGMLTRAKIEYQLGVGEFENDLVTVYAKQGPNNLGYNGFLTEFVFDGEGRLIRMGSWE